MSQIFSNSIGELLAKTDVELDPVEKAASLVFVRAARFMEGYSPQDEIVKICKQFFGDTNSLQKHGLIHHYVKMKEYIVSKTQVGLVLFGVNTKELLIDYYPTNQNNIITLTVDSICKVLIREHFTKSEVDSLCRSTEGFHIYYKP